MSQSMQLMGGVESQALPARERVSVLWVVLASFIFGAIAVSPLEGWNYVVKAFGVVLAAAFLINTIRAQAGISAEIGLFIAWLAWALTGVFVAVSSVLFWYQWTTTFQVWVLLVIVAGFTSSRKALSLNLLAFVAGAAVVGFYSYLTGEYERAEAGETRVSGLAVNANQFGWIMFLASVAMAYFWMLPTRARLLKHVVLAAGLLAAGFATVLSGSRTALAGIAIFYALWLLFCYRKYLLGRPLVAAAGVVAVVLLVGLLFSYMAQTGVMGRFEEGWRALQGQRTRESGAHRLLLLRVAWDMIWQYPLTGVGLGNFRAMSGTQMFSHSEFSEVAVATGLPGFVVYFSIFYVLWRRAGRLAKNSDDPVDVRTAGLIRATILTMLFMDFGRWNYYDKVMWIVFGSFIGYTASAWNALRARLPQFSGRAAA